MNSYELSRAWFDFCYENPEKIKPHHTALYFFIIEHCNRLGWKEKFGLPTTMAKEAIGIRSYNTYINTLRDLVEWKFVKMIEVSKNQYSSNIVALSSNVKAVGKALDKALIKHGTKQSESTGSIDKPNNKEQLNKEQRALKFASSVKEFNNYDLKMLEAFIDYWTESRPTGKKLRFEAQMFFDIGKRLVTWKNRDKPAKDSDPTGRRQLESREDFDFNK